MPAFDNGRSLLGDHDRKQNRRWLDKWAPVGAILKARDGGLAGPSHVSLRISWPPPIRCTPDRQWSSPRPETCHR
jgi:hypothetical protein